MSSGGWQTGWILCREAVLRPGLDRDPGSYCFVPAETSAWNDRRLRRGAPWKSMWRTANRECSGCGPG